MRSVLLQEGNDVHSDLELITTSLTALIGLPFSRSTRAGSMRCFHFGKLVEAPPSALPHLDKKPRGMVGDLALHVQCPWRLDTETSIVTGLTDLWQPIPNCGTIDYDAWDWDRDGNLQDQRMADYFSQYPNSKVRSVSPFEHGSFTLHLSENVKLFVFVSGCASEDWRIFRHSSYDTHFVVTGGIAELETDE